MLDCLHLWRFGLYFEDAIREGSIYKKIIAVKLIILQENNVITNYKSLVY